MGDWGRGSSSKVLIILIYLPCEGVRKQLPRRFAPPLSYEGEFIS
jgi:hypothetical protein